MKLEKHLNSVEDVEQLMLWMQTPAGMPKPVITFDAEHYLERLQLADKWLRQHMSVRKVWPMLQAHWKAKGISYTERTARRDVEDAQRLFAELESHTAKYWSSLMLDMLQEKLVSAHINGKLTEFARISKEIREWLRYADELGVRDRSKLLDEVPRVLLFAPEETGIEPNPNALEEAQLWLDQRKERLKAKRAPHVTDAQFTEDATPSPDAAG